MIIFNISYNVFIQFFIFVIQFFVLAHAKKKTENGGKGTKRQIKKKIISSDSDSEEMFSSKQTPVSKIYTLHKNIKNKSY